MKINKRILKALLFIIGVIWIGNVLFYYSKKIDGPIFTYTYYEGRGLSTLSYLMDENDKDKVKTIIFPEVDNFEINVQEDEGYNFFGGLNNNNIDDRNSDGSVRYNINNINLNTARNSEGIQLTSIEQDFNITKVKYKTINGKEGECEIGKIIHKKESSLGNYEDRPYHLFSTYGKSSSSDGVDREIFRALDDIKVIGIAGEFKDELLEYCDIKINGQEIRRDCFPIEISRKRDIDVSIQHYKSTPFYVNFSSNLKVIAKDPEGTEEKMDIDVSISNNKITYKDVDNLLEKRGLK